jgi:class 3 adenylate cyclase
MTGRNRIGERFPHPKNFLCRILESMNRVGIGPKLFLLAVTSLWPARVAGAETVRAIASYVEGSGALLVLGEWERYQGYLTEGALASTPREPELVDTRPRYLPLEKSPRKAGPATFRARILLAAPERKSPRQMALYVPGIRLFDSVAVNGEELYDRAKSPEPSPLLYFSVEGDTVSVMLQSAPERRQVAETFFLPLAVFVGSPAEANFAQLLLTGIAVAAGFWFFCLALFALLLFFFKRKDVELIGAAFLFLSAGAFFVFKTVLALGLIPGLVHLRDAEIAYALGLDLLVLGIVVAGATGFRRRLGRHVALALEALPIALAGAKLLYPDFVRELYVASLALTALLFAAVAVGSLSAVKDRDRSPLWLLPAVVSGCAMAGALLALNPSFATIFVLGPALAAAASAFVALMLASKIGEGADCSDALSEYADSISKTIHNFIPREFVDALEKKDVADLRLGDHVRKEMTIFFSDIRAFTELSEKLTVEENFSFINSYLSRVVPVVRENGGFIDKYVGDAIMALYAGTDGADRAIRTAIAMQAKMQEYNGHRAKSGYRPIAMSVGIHTGDLMLGVVGVHDRMESTVISDAVNVASRLQALSKSFNVSLAISERTFKDLADPGSYKYRFIGKVRVKGKAAPLSVFEIFDGVEPGLFERKMSANTFFEQGMLAYYRKDFPGAMYYFERVLEMLPEDGAAAFYLESCRAKARA